MMNSNKHIAFCDGSSLGNPGPGGWGALLVRMGGTVVEMGGREKRTTNNRMELTAAIEVLRTLTDEEGDLSIHTDSSYVLQGATRWVRGWAENGWVTATKEPVANEDLWKDLLQCMAARKKFGSTSWVKVPGHSGVPGNERADAIATAFAADETPELYNGLLADYAYDVLSIAADPGAEDARSKARSRSRAKAYSYVSKVGGSVMFHRTWAECEARVMGKPGAKYQKALSKEDEALILRKWGGMGS